MWRVNKLTDDISLLWSTRFDARLSQGNQLLLQWIATRCSHGFMLPRDKVFGTDTTREEVRTLFVLTMHFYGQSNPLKNGLKRLVYTPETPLWPNEAARFLRKAEIKSNWKCVLRGEA